MLTFRVSVNRPLDLERFTDRLALGSLFCFGLAGYLRGGWAEAVRSGLGAYLSWALVREIDPDHPVSANLAALAGGTLALGYRTDVGVMLVMLLAAKVMVGGSGLPPARWEAAVLGASAMVFAGTTIGWWAAVAMAAALFLDTLSRPFAPRAQRPVAAGVVVGATIVFLSVGEWSAWWWAHPAAVTAGGLFLSRSRLDLYRRLRYAAATAGAPALVMAVAAMIRGEVGEGPWLLYGLSAVGLVFGVVLGVVKTEVNSPTDHADHLISSERVGSARCLLAAFVIVSCASGLNGTLIDAVGSAAPLWAVLILVGGRESWARKGRTSGKSRP